MPRKGKPCPLIQRTFIQSPGDPSSNRSVITGSKPSFTPLPLCNPIDYCDVRLFHKSQYSVFMMHEGMDDPHNFAVHLNTNDPNNLDLIVNLSSNWIP